LPQPGADIGVVGGESAIGIDLDKASDDTIRENQV